MYKQSFSIKPRISEKKRRKQSCTSNIIDRTTEELYKNYRIYCVPFNENIYLNDLKTRLLPTAIPNATQTSNFMINPTCIVTLTLFQDIIFCFMFYSTEADFSCAAYVATAKCYH